MLNATSHLLLRRGSGAEPVRRRGASGDSGAEHWATAWRKLWRAGPGGGARWLEAAARGGLRRGGGRMRHAGAKVQRRPEAAAAGPPGHGGGGTSGWRAGHSSSHGGGGARERKEAWEG